MRELRDADFREKYIRGKCREIAGANITKESISFIDEGAMNFVYRAATPRGNLFFKQALERAKKEGRIGHDLASIPYLRIRYERNVIDRLKDVLPPDIKVPDILAYDQENNILVLSDVLPGSVLLQDALLKGDFNEKVASNIGKFLGISHRHTYEKDNVVRANAEEDMDNWKVFLNMRTRGIKTENDDVRAELIRMYEDALENHTYDVLINMDCCPKNTFQREDGSIGLIDFELASGVGDPAYDIGFALGHYILFAILKGVPSDSIHALEAIVDSYNKEVRGIDFGNLNERIIKYAGAIPIYRVSGSSPASYIPKEKIPELIEKGSIILKSNCSDIEEVSLLLGNLR